MNLLSAPTTSQPELSEAEKLVLEMGRDPRLAHAVLFPHRHHNLTPEFHYEIIELWHSSIVKVLIQAFRGAAKSTIAEEAIIVQACLRQFKNGIILGETYERAVERLRAIKHEFETNTALTPLFGDLVGTTWSEGKIILANGVIIQAFGRGQSLRGSKHLDWRPDRAFGDDIENEESVASEEAIAKTMRWLMSVVMPALDPSALVRINGTPLHPNSVIAQLEKDPSWVGRKYPIEYVSETGERAATWPDRFSLPWIDEKKADYERLGLHDNYQQEFMCRAEDLTQKAFLPEYLRVEPVMRTWQATYAMYDPARTARPTSASTGVVIFSWLSNRLIVWDAYGPRWKPDEIISDMFRVDQEYKPVTIGVEEDGLNEFIMQPLRQEQLRRSYAIPIRAMRAPREKTKIDFIKGLQPFFKAREIIFVKELPELKTQLLGFPIGTIDIPNALAYALHLRPGQPIYEGFGDQHVVVDLPIVASAPRYLALNATRFCTTAVLLQVINGGLHVIGDWVREGDAGANIGTILTEAGVVAQGKVRLYAGPGHFSKYDDVGLRAAARQIPTELGRGGAELVGREELRGLLGRVSKGRPMVRVASTARWTLNAFAGGYCKEVTKTGLLTEFATEGPYKVLMEGLEAFAALMKSPIVNDDMPVHYAYSNDGRRYITSLGSGRDVESELKIPGR